RPRDGRRVASRAHQKTPGAATPSLDHDRFLARGPPDEGVRRAEGVLGAREGRDEARARVRDGQDLERRLDDDPERPERADDELVEVIAGDVLNDAASRASGRPVGEGEARADEEVADR